LRRRRSCFEATFGLTITPATYLYWGVVGCWCHRAAGASQVVSSVKMTRNKIGQKIAIPLEATDRLFFFRGPLLHADAGAQKHTQIFPEGQPEAQCLSRRKVISLLGLRTAICDLQTTKREKGIDTRRYI
jgi:hypothetical protein